MSAQHTPSPWEAVANGEGMPPVRIGHTVKDRQGDGHSSHCIAILQFKGHHETTANANLIAAAPELLDALKDAIELIYALDGKDNSCDPMTDISDLRAVVAKATGVTP